jgi:glycosyltransferase involved in cell wall biosynthesis
VRASSIHLVNPLSRPFGGSEKRTLDYYALLVGHADVRLWAEEEPDASLSGLPIERIDPSRKSFPRGGTIVLVGVFISREHWLEQAQAERLVIVYNTPELHRLHALLEYCERSGLPRPELVFPSEAHRQSAGLGGFIDSGVYDFDVFKPGVRKAVSTRFTVGRLSRDEDYKHHPQDLRLYRALIDRGIHVRLMGASLFAERLRPTEKAIELLPAGALPAPEFLCSLDAFVYRTDPSWRETWGRVVVEAMACALPVVVGRSGGYRELIEHGTNGFVFDAHQEAIACLEALRADSKLAQRIGAAARETVVGRFGSAYRARLLEFLLDGGRRADGG